MKKWDLSLLRLSHRKGLNTQKISKTYEQFTQRPRKSQKKYEQKHKLSKPLNSLAFI